MCVTGISLTGRGTKLPPKHLNLLVLPSTCRRQSELSSSWFIVVFSNGQWWVDHEGKPYGPYASATEARDGAVRLARSIGGERNWEVFAPGAEDRHILVASRRGEADAVGEEAPDPAEGD